MPCVLGFDPGGRRRFGWCVLSIDAPLPRLVRAGCGDSSADALDAAVDAAGRARVLAAGIDAPLYWSKTGHRQVDNRVRARIQELHRNARTVLQLNSLRGACLAQGILVAVALRDRWPRLRLVESHPKASLQLLDWRTSTTVTELHRYLWYLECEDSGVEHERDAALAAHAAWRSLGTPRLWRNYAQVGPSDYTPLVPLPQYWLPRLGRRG